MLIVINIYTYDINTSCVYYLVHKQAEHISTHIYICNQYIYYITYT